MSLKLILGKLRKSSENSSKLYEFQTITKGKKGGAVDKKEIWSKGH